MDDRDPDRRLKLEAEILFHLWVKGATPLYKLLQAFPTSSREARAAVSSLAAKRYIYRLFEPPEDEAGAVYYLTSHARACLERLFHGDPRYHLKELWYALKREETKVGPPQVRLGGT
ncbi:MAG: hypothetical protein ACE5LD_02610 [Candidatus Bipolaricaulia bacterium]